MSDLKSIYRDVILDHYKRPRNASLLAPVESAGGLHHARCKNPSCGDKVLLQLDIQDGVASGVGYEGVGCAISQASASMLTMAVKGKSVDELKALLAEFRRMIIAGAQDPSPALLGDLITLQGVAQLHARVKCALCAWSALEAILEERGDINMDEDLPTSSSAVG